MAGAGAEGQEQGQGMILMRMLLCSRSKNSKAAAAAILAPDQRSRRNNKYISNVSHHTDGEGLSEDPSAPAALDTLFDVTFIQLDIN
jgi:hypothetical protein